MSIFCKTCGASNEDDALFCSSCGNAFEQKKPDPAPAEPVIQTASEPVSAPVNEAPSASANPDPAPNQGFNALLRALPTETIRLPLLRLLPIWAATTLSAEHPTTATFLLRKQFRFISKTMQHSAAELQRANTGLLICLHL